MSTFPQPFTSTTSHWQATNRGETSLYLYNAEKPLPKQADIVIVGGGTMGATLSYFVTRKGAEGEGKSIVLVEAKEIASGASGRNGGHVGPATSELFHHIISPVGKGGAGVSPEEAIHIIQAEKDNLDLIENLLETEGEGNGELKKKVDWWRGDLVETHRTTADTALALKQYQAWLGLREKAGLSGTGETRFVQEPLEAQRIARMEDVNSIQLRPAGSVHSHKLCTEIMRLAINSKHSNFELHTWTPVTSLEPPSTKDEKGFTVDGDGLWTVKTTKGEIQAPRVILCTNAHTKNFFPDEQDQVLAAHIRPRRIMACYVTPTPTFSGKQSLKHTYNIPYGDYYLIQGKDGGIVFGGGSGGLIADGRLDRKWLEKSVDDSEVHEEWGKDFKTYCQRVFTNWGPEAPGEGMTKIWSGIITDSKDTLPVIGEVPGKSGLFVAAGFHGHGQSRIFSCGQALASLLQTGKWDTRLPSSYELTTERLERVNEAMAKAEKEVGHEITSFMIVDDERSNRPVETSKAKEGWSCVVS